MRYDAVIYDLDGTLLNTLDDLALALNLAMAQGGFAQHSTARVASMLGDGMEMLIRRALPASAAQDEAVLLRTLAAFKQCYAAHANDRTAPYPGVRALLEQLDALGARQAVVSNKADPFVKALCQRHFGHLVAAAVGEQPGVRRKPAPDSVRKVMADLGCVPARTLYVGDSEVDIRTAANAGLDCACVCWGLRTEEQLRRAGAETLAHSTQELLHIILG